MKLELGARTRIAGKVRAPDQEGALAHLDVERGFALVARGQMGPADVIDPTIWVREKVSLALSRPADPDDPPLRRLIGALRSLHAELMARPEGERPWVALHVLLLQRDEAAAVSAGDCPCFRFRSGLLSYLGRTEADRAPRPPRGALGSEAQVRIDVVPLRPLPGDIYALSTRPMREGEVAVLARDLTVARTSVELLHFGVEGSSDRGCVAVRILDSTEEDVSARRSEAVASALAQDEGAMPEAPEGEEGLGDWSAGPLQIETLEPATEAPELGGWNPPAWAAPALADFPAGPRVAEPSGGTAETRLEERADASSGAIPVVEESALGDAPADAPWVEAPPPAEEVGSVPADVRGEETAASANAPAVQHDAAPAANDRDRAAADRVPLVPDGARPWYEPLAIWGGGALAIVALALLIRALLPGILGVQRPHVAAPPPAATPQGLADIYSDPPGATVRVDGATLAGRTPLLGVALDAGIHRIELDWGPYGSWSDTVDATVGTKVTVHPAVFGSASFASSDPARVLDVYLDGAYEGTTPLSLDQVLVGRHLVRFSGPGAAASAQEIEVSRGGVTQLVGSAGPSPKEGRVTVKTALLGDEGFESGKGDPVWVDGVARGVTPATIDVAPGTHSVRVARRGYPPQITVLDVKPEEERFVTAEFSSESVEPLRYTPPEYFSVSSQTPVMLDVGSGDWDPSTALWLYAAAPGGSFQEKRMTRLEEGSHTFAALLPPEVIRNSAHKVRFYFKAAGPTGREMYSEIYTVPLRD
jgi:hypothetical protein